MSNRGDDNHGRPLPPEKTRWKKGTSGNPQGRPKKDRSLTSLLKTEIEKICPADKEGRTWGELVVRATLQLSLKGHAAALREVWERVDGKIMQMGKLEVASSETRHITVKVVYDGNEELDTPNS